MQHSSLFAMQRLLDIMARLRDPVQGCPWDVQQDFASIAPYTVEEAYEVAEAIANQDMPALREELGDLLLQVVFHAQMAEEAGLFDFTQVAEAIAQKMTERHPHVFADAAPVDVQAQQSAWEESKAKARAAKHSGALADIPLALPALMRAQKMGKRVSRIGFDWPDLQGARRKLDEELAEFDAADNVVDQMEELGDVLFCVTNLARHAGLDAEAALRQANHKFTTRWQRMETLAALAGSQIEGQPLSVMEEWWQQAKREEKNAP
ncbi:MAG: nucleoside triphosphate pyrophosphohydrolase [Rickettsiales bacterium]|nr:nucleoside triphosphate pyrophosphohydrolase [Rickettsiales bacterium]